MKITSRGLPPRGAPYFLRPSPSNVPSAAAQGISRGLPRRARLQNHLLDLCEIECPPPLPSQQSRRASPRLIPFVGTSTRLIPFVGASTRLIPFVGASEVSRFELSRLIPSCVEIRRDKPTPTSLTWCANPDAPLLRRGLIGAGRAA